MSPTGGPASPTASTHARVVSPTNGPTSPVALTKNGFNPSVLGTRSPSPRMRNNEAIAGSGGDRPAPPPDAFYYGRSPTMNGHPGRPGSISGSAELLKELKAKEAEAQSARAREAALRVILSRAVKQGYVLPEGEEEDAEPKLNGATNPGDDVVKRLTDALVKMKQEKAAIQVSHFFHEPSGRGKIAEPFRRMSSLRMCVPHRKKHLKPSGCAEAPCRKRPFTVPKLPRSRTDRHLT